MKTKWKNLLKDEKIRKRAFYTVAGYLIYMIVFFFLEERGAKYHVINISLDKLIPFCPYFIVPYFLWFPYVGLTFVYMTLFSKDDRSYRKCIILTLTGVLTFIAVSVLYPNIQLLRPELTDGNIFVQMVKFLYTIDTPTNILPSLHVYMSLVCMTTIRSEERLSRNRWLVHGTELLSVSIILATVFLKQHTLIDVASAMALHSVCRSVLQMSFAERRRISYTHD